MDKKELNDLIDRIVLTGPGGTYLIKKVLKKLVNGSNDDGGGSGGGDGSGSASSLSDMTDVDISSPSDGDTLVYNATTHKWESGSGGGGGCSCLAPMFVSGTVDEGVFTPGDGAASWSDANEQMFNGGLVYLVTTEDGEPVVVFLATFANPDTIAVSTDGEFIFWNKPSGGGGGADIF